MLERRCARKDSSCVVTPDPRMGPGTNGAFLSSPLEMFKDSQVVNNCVVVRAKLAAGGQRWTPDHLTHICVGGTLAYMGSPTPTWSHQSEASLYSLNPLQVPSPPRRPVGGIGRKNKYQVHPLDAWAWVAPQLGRREPKTVKSVYKMMTVREWGRPELAKVEDAGILWGKWEGTQKKGVLPCAGRCGSGLRDWQVKGCTSLHNHTCVVCPHLTTTQLSLNANHKAISNHRCPAR